MALETQEQILRVTIRAGEISAKIVVAMIKALVGGRDTIKHGKQSLKQLNLQNRELQDVSVERQDLRALRRQLNRYSVDFSIKRNPEVGTFEVYFKSQDIERVYKGFKKSLKDFAREPEFKRNIREVMADAARRSAEQTSKSKEQTIEKAERGQELR